MMSSADPNTAGALLVVYDSECAFCRRSIEAIRRRDRYGQFVYMPRRTPGLEVQYPQLTIGDFNTGMRLINIDGTLYIGSDAIHQIASRLPYFRWFVWMYHLPLIHGLTRWIYAWVAANRMKLSQYCVSSTCKITNDSAEQRNLIAKG